MRDLGQHCRRRSHVVVTIVLCLTLIFGVIAIGIDLSWLAAAKRQLQVTSDNTALAAAHYLVNNYPDLPEPLGVYGASFMQTENPVENLLLTPEHVTTAWANLQNGRVTTIEFTGPGEPFNAVYVDVAMSDDNPALPAFFGQFFGYEEYQPYAQSLVLIEPPSTPDVMPFTINEDDWFYPTVCCNDPPAGDQSQCCYFPGQETCCRDDWSWSEAAGAYGQSDDEHEAIIYPLPQGHPCPGNFGALGAAFGCGNDAGCMWDLIDNGISPEQMQIAFGTPTPIFPASPPGYEVESSPGQMNSMESHLKARVGDVVGIFIHTFCYGQGNATYYVTDLVYGRIMDVQLGGQGDGLILQPVDLDEEDFEPKVIGLAL